MGEAFEQLHQDLQQYNVISGGTRETLYWEQDRFGFNGRDDYDYDADDYDSDDDEDDEDDDDDDEDFGFDDDDGGFNFDDNDEDSFGDEEE